MSAPRLAASLLVALTALAGVASARGAEADWRTLHWDLRTSILETMQVRCEDLLCNPEAESVAIGVIEQVAAGMTTRQIRYLKSGHPLPASPPDTSAEDAAYPDTPRSIGEALDEAYRQDSLEGTPDGRILLAGAANSHCGPVAYVIEVERGSATEFDVMVEVTGDCGCQLVAGTPLGAFNLLKSRRFVVEDRGYGLVHPRPTDDMRCTVSPQCDCATELPADAVPGQDHNASEPWHLTVNAGQALAESRRMPHMGQDSCGNAASPAVRQMVDAIILEHDADRTLAFGVGGMELPEVGLMRQAGEIFGDVRSNASWTLFSAVRSVEGTVPSTCGAAPFEYLLETELFWTPDEARFDVWMEVDLLLTGRCDCDPAQATEQISDVTYRFRLRSEVLFIQATRTATIQPGTGESDIRAQCRCPTQPLADDLAPLAAELVVSSDSAAHCTYGGGSSSFWLPGASGTGAPGAPPWPPGPVTNPSGPWSPFPAGVSTPGSRGAGHPTPGQTATPALPPVIPGGPAEGTDSPDSQPDDPWPADPPAAPATGEPDGIGSEPAQAPEDEPTPAPPVTITVKATNAALEAGANVSGAGGMITLAPEPGGIPGEMLADTDAQSGASEGENSHLIQAGDNQIPVSAELAALLGGAPLTVDITPRTGNVLQFPGTVTAAEVLPEPLLGYVRSTFTVGDFTYVSTLVPTHLAEGLEPALQGSGALSVEPDLCVDPKPLADPLFSTTGTWSQPYPDQWGIQRIGFVDGKEGAWNLVEEDRPPVVIAVIDSGLDWNHLDLDRQALWRNPGEIPANGLDDDGNGYIDDLIGWDFWDDDRKPWDVDGHGTFVAGVLFARSDNRTGIAGISRNARLMVLKVMNAFGHSRASKVAQAIIYAVDNGARVINLSLGGPGTSTVVREAIQYAYERDVVVVAAAGNEAAPADAQVVSGLPNALTVAAVNVKDRRSIYSNYGPGIDVAAPGDDILSLRARRTDLLLNIPGVDYTAETAFVGTDRRYYRASGTSFAAPMVAGVAGLLLANQPELSAEQVMRMIRNSARDVETPGIDHFTGYGVVDAAAALRADPQYFIEAGISGVEVHVEGGRQMVRVLGLANAQAFAGAELMIGPGTAPDAWTAHTPVERTAAPAALGSIEASEFAAAKEWTIRLVVRHENGSAREFRFRLSLG